MDPKVSIANENVEITQKQEESLLLAKEVLERYAGSFLRIKKDDLVKIYVEPPLINDVPTMTKKDTDVMLLKILKDGIQRVDTKMRRLFWCYYNPMTRVSNRVWYFGIDDGKPTFVMMSVCHGLNEENIPKKLFENSVPLEMKRGSK